MVFDKTGMVATGMGLGLAPIHSTIKAKNITKFCVNDCKLFFHLGNIPTSQPVQ
jgi:hypothetical protein